MKIGDTVRCIDSKESKSLDLWNTYKIVEINNFGNIGVQEMFGLNNTLQHFYKPARFELVSAKKKVAEKPPVPKIDFSEKYKTRNGDEVKLLTTSTDPDFPIIGVILEKGKEPRNMQWTSEGLYLKNITSDEDLVEIQQDITVNCSNFTFSVYNDGSAYIKNFNTSLTLERNEMLEIIKAFDALN